MAIYLPMMLFMAQSVNGIHAGGLQGRKIPENNAHSRREEKRNNDDGEVRDKGNRQHFCGTKGGCQGQDDSENTAKGGEYHGLH